MSGYVNEYFLRLKGYDRERLPWVRAIGTPAMPSASETPQLQAADVLSYLTYGYFSSRAANNLAPAPRGAGPDGEFLEAIMRNSQGQGYIYFDERAMRSELEGVALDTSSKTD